MRKDKDIKILKDEPISKKEADFFGYSDIAENIADLILKINPPFTIGLFGKWGVGKTSICLLIKRYLSKKIPVFYFDAWKYEKDSFRRQFLIELDNDIFKGRLDFRSKLNQSLTFPKATNWKNNILMVLKELRIKSLGVFLLIFLFLIGLKYLVIPYTVKEIGLSDLLKRLVDFGIIGNVLSFILQSFRQYQYSVQVPRVDSAEWFEYYYNEAIRKTKKNKLLIIIDNIDRLGKEKAIGLLSDIRTFLVKEKVSNKSNKSIFLIPCDNEAISSYLKKVYNNNEEESEEFLRKFFNASFKIPKLIKLELDKYIEEKLNETNIPQLKDNRIVSFVAMMAFRDNPREIVQFINSLVFYFTLAEKRNLSTVVENPQFLAKILVIRQKWPQFYSEVENEVIRTGKSLEDFSGNDQVRQFLKDVESVTAQDQDIFFSLTQSKEEKGMPEWISFILSAEEKRQESLSEIYKKIQKEKKTQAIDTLLRGYIEKNKGRKTKLMNVFVSVHKLVNEDNIKDFKNFLTYSFHFLKGEFDLFINQIKEVDFEKIINREIFTIIGEEFTNEWTETIVHILTSTKDSNPVISLEDGINLFKILDKDSIWRNFEKYNDELDIAKSNFIKIVNVSNIISENKGLEDKLKFIVEIKPILKKSFLSGIEKIREFLNNPQIGENRWIVYQYLLRFIQGHSALFNELQTSSNFIDTLDNISLQIVNDYNQGHPENKGLLIKIIISLLDYEKAYNSQLVSIINQFLENANIPFEIIKSSISKRIITSLIEKYSNIKNAIISRSNTNPDVLIKFNLSSILNDQEIQSILNSQISNLRYPSLFSTLEYLGYKVPEDFRKTLIQSLIKGLNQINDANQFGEVLDAISKLRIINYPDLSGDVFFRQLRLVKSKGGELQEKIRLFFKKKRNKGILSESQRKDLLDNNKL